jgi:Na+/H+ antiporter NhaD/arsenite permease-like protein
MSLVYICISLDLTGFFEYLALRVAKAAGKSGPKLFLYFYFLAAFLTIFTSNDIVILTLTPIIIYFTKYTKTNPIPFLIAQFFAANIWSIMLYIGNPTNIIVAEANHLTFLGYTQWSFLPTIAAGLTSLVLLWLVFRKQISRELILPDVDVNSAMRDKKGAIFGIICFISCLIMLTISPLLNLALWQICLSFAIVMLIRDIVYDKLVKQNNKLEKRVLPKIATRMPWKIIPFVIGMFILVEALVAVGWVDLLAAWIAQGSTTLVSSVFIMIGISTLACNIMNNQPMTILFTNLLISPSYNLASQNMFGAMFALIMGSNFGANITLLGALAGIMWFRILLDKEIKITFKQFLKYGLIIMPLVIIIGAFTLIGEILLFY